MHTHKQGLIVYKGEDVVFERTLEVRKIQHVCAYDIDHRSPTLTTLCTHQYKQQTDIALDGLRFARERGVSIIAFRSIRWSIQECRICV